MQATSIIRVILSALSIDKENAKKALFALILIPVLIVGFLCTLVSAPFLLLANANDTEIRDMQEMYYAVDSKIKTYIDGLVTRTAETISHDILTVIDNTGSIDSIALMAIDATRYEQDFTRSNEQEIFELAKQYISLSTSTVEHNIPIYDEEDPEEVIDTVTEFELIITVNFISFDDVLNSLGFSDEEIELAKLIYDNTLSLSSVPYDVSSSTLQEINNYIATYRDVIPDTSTDLIVPVNCSKSQLHISSHYGYRQYVTDPGRGSEFHTGMDIAIAAGSDIYAAQDGIVLFVKDLGNKSYGKHLAIYHGGDTVTLYAHCKEIYVSAGQTVSKGDVIAAVGSTGRSTGPHLHFEVIRHGEYLNPYYQVRD